MTEYPYEQWIIVSRFRHSGDRAYLGERKAGGLGLIPYRGSAYRYRTEMSARGAAYSYQDLFPDGEFEVERLPNARDPDYIN